MGVCVVGSAKDIEIISGRNMFWWFQKDPLSPYICPGLREMYYLDLVAVNMPS